MSELQLDSSVRVPFEMGLLDGQASSLMPTAAQGELPQGSSPADRYTGPELVLPEVVTQEAAQQIDVAEKPQTWRDRLANYARKATIITTLGSVAALGVACSSENPGSGSAQPGGVLTSASASPGQSKPEQPLLVPDIYACKMTGDTEFPSKDSRVRTGTSVDERAVAKLLKTTPADIAKCDRPKYFGEPADSVVTSAEYIQKSTGDHVVTTVVTDELDAQSGLPNHAAIMLRDENVAGASMNYNSYVGAFAYWTSPDDPTHIAGYEGMLTPEIAPRSGKMYDLIVTVVGGAVAKSGFGGIKGTRSEIIDKLLPGMSDLLGNNIPLTISPTTPS